MSQTNSVSKKGGQPRLLLLMCAVVALWVALPFIVQLVSTTTHAQAANEPSLVADLTGAPIADVTPHGFGAYFVAASATPDPVRQLFVGVSNVNLPAGTQLSVSLNSAGIGMITLDMHGHGFLMLSTANGGTVPDVMAGDTLSIDSSAAVITSTYLTGIFGTPPTPSPTVTHTPFPTPSHTPFPTPSHTPFPTPSHTPFPTPSHTPPPTHSPSPTPTGSPVPEVHFFAPLHGDPIGGIMPRGIGQYEDNGTNQELEVYVSFVNLDEGTMLNVSVGAPAGSPTDLVGTITLHEHRGALHLSTENGGTVPVIANGSTLTVTNADATVLAGVFSDTPPPPPTHTPTASPTGTPVPLPAHVFAARLNGANEVPPVTTDGRGKGFVMLSPDETQIRVHVGCIHLSSAATTITINGPAMVGENGPVIFTLTLPATLTGNTVDTFDVTAEQVDQLRTGLWYFQVATSGNPDGEIRGQIHSVNHRDDFDGDGQSDISVTRQVAGIATDNNAFQWYILNSSDNTVGNQSMGRIGDVNVQGDYDGDGIADIAMFTPATGMWQIRGSVSKQPSIIHWGTNGDIPVVGDYDGDGINDLAVFRPSQGNWYIKRSSDGGITAVHWGANGDRPVSGDFDGDGRNDMAVFRPADGNWYINRSSNGGVIAMHWGLNGDQPVAGDFDGDGASDIAVFRPSDGNWYIYRSSDNQFTAFHFGLSGDIPVPCEFDGDGISDIAVFRPADGMWYVNRSSDQTMAAYRFGIATDHPIATVYAP